MKLSTLVSVTMAVAAAFGCASAADPQGTSSEVAGTPPAGASSDIILGESSGEPSASVELEAAPMPGSECDRFGPNEIWMEGAFKGDFGTFVADVTGDGLGDAIAVNRNKIYVRRSDGRKFWPNEEWTQGPFLDDSGRNFFADVTGDGLADAIVVNNDKIYVRRSNGKAFEPNEEWTPWAFIGQVLQGFADVTGDGLADAVVLNGDAAYVMISNGYYFEFFSAWTPQRTPWPFKWHLGDIDGDGRADLLGVGCDFAKAYSNGFGFSDYEYEAEQCSWFPNFFADINGDRAVEALVVNGDGITACGWKPYRCRKVTCGRYVSNGAGQTFADVNGDGMADAIVFNKTATVVRLAQWFPPWLD